MGGVSVMPEPRPEVDVDWYRAELDACRAEIRTLTEENLRLQARVRDLETTVAIRSKILRAREELVECHCAERPGPHRHEEPF